MPGQLSEQMKARYYELMAMPAQPMRPLGVRIREAAWHREVWGRWVDIRDVPKTIHESMSCR